MQKKAFDFTDQHRGDFAREQEHAFNSKNKGHVADPEHDHRLSENKNKDQEEIDRKKKEEEEERAKQDEVNRQKQKLEEIKMMQEQRAASSGLKAASVEEMYLRNHPTYGASISKIIGNQRVNLASLKEVRKALINHQNKTASIEEKNEIHKILSSVAALMIKSGALKNG